MDAKRLARSVLVAVLVHISTYAGEGSSTAAAVTTTQFPWSIPLQAPLTTLIECPTQRTGSRRITAILEVPANAPTDLGIGVWAKDRDARWFQYPLPGRLTPGHRRISFAMDANAAFQNEPGVASWNAETAATCPRSGLYLWSPTISQARITVISLNVTDLADDDRPTTLGHVVIDGLGSDQLAHGTTGERWSLRVRPDPWPADPYDPEQFKLDARIGLPNGTEIDIPGFCLQEMSGSDGGDREVVSALSPTQFAVRFRPWLPGRHRIVLRWSDAQQNERTLTLPDLLVTGRLFQDIVRVDPADSRYFTLNGSWFWPIGLNLHSTYDKRSAENRKTKLTPARGSLVYASMLDRFAAAGGNVVELWMSSWNLALEWRADWPGYQGLGRYNQENAWRLDRVLDHAAAVGVRVNLVINNHGQASPKADREWKDNPYNKLRGGPLSEPAELFVNASALKGQEQLRRYLVARYADHPAVLGWKLWSEVDLTAGKGPPVAQWHEQASTRWHALDAYRHPVTTHWAGDYRRVDPAVAVVKGIDYLTIDSYRNADRTGAWSSLADLLANSTQDPLRGIFHYKKPCLVTEYGASSSAAPDWCISIDHRCGPWIALVCGHAGSPMLWWWEWVDQGNRWKPYGAIRRFIAGEDLRGTDATGTGLNASGSHGALWCRAWVRPGRLLAYVRDKSWGITGDSATLISSAWIDIGDQVLAGNIQIEWWDCDSGNMLTSETLHHPGGNLRLICPEFTGHIAFKLIRR